MDVEAQVMSRNSMASGLPVKKFLISGPSSSMKKQDLGNILITNPVSNHRAYEEFQTRNHMLAAVSESDGFSNLFVKVCHRLLDPELQLPSSLCIAIIPNLF